MKLSGWGRYPVIDSLPEFPVGDECVMKLIEAHGSGPLIGRGLGRSYGDSALAPTAVHSAYLDYFRYFDKQTGILRCAAGVSLASVLELIVPEGWFLPVTPGTKYVTVGGAVASDVHGKNHHIDGCFSEFVQSITIATANGIVECSKTSNAELFCATCGGMGLTGFILEVEIRLKRISSSFIQATTIKTKNIAETVEALDIHRSATYSVAWIDCLSTGKGLGRSLIMLGEHADDGGLQTGCKARLSVPFDVPGLFLNGVTMQAFNSVYYHRVTKAKSRSLVSYEPYFYPLDGVRNWNRLYGSDGFLQYQFVIPRKAGIEGLTVILNRLAASKRGSFLAVLKLFGEENSNYLSFPMEGYTLALDLKRSPEVFALLDELDDVVVGLGGRIYLAKDARMSKSIFQASYPGWESFSQLRRQWGADNIFNSIQSIRLGL
ncbi:FAD-binding oxidoreductase [Microbulbifer sp. YPW1]|uniref:FAD-binding oxidoreductase n=1 Tax=Microbulbifer sp. YPW1 TaxID=2745199 RepID=UPI0015975692|nr:FAD-binding oxidoreductase [Microbulbifer sp. YPW1]QKX15654.1 FAD-binding oxidoreductase [Microbulbifer sp. YPW1]